MFPGKILKLFNTESIQFIDVLNSPLRRFYRPFLKLSQKNIGKGRYDVEVFAKGKEIQEKEKGQYVEPVAPDMGAR